MQYVKLQNKLRIEGFIVQLIVTAALLLLPFYNPVIAKASADEKIGNLVFDAMKEIEENHKSFLERAKVTKIERETALAERENVKKQYDKARPGSLDKTEFHARFSLTQAKVYRALFEETKLTHAVSKRQLSILNRLNNAIDSGQTQANIDGVNSVIEASKPFLENGKSLLVSLSEYRNRIQDPIINSKLNGAYDTARMLSNYVKHIEKGRTNKYASHLLLKQKISDLIEQLNALYVQTDIFMSMIKDKTTVLKMINELAASESAIKVLVTGSNAVNHLSSDVMKPLMDILITSDEHMELLITGVLDDPNEITNKGNSQEWAQPNF